MISLGITFAVLLLIAWGAYSGYRAGIILVGLEFISLVAALTLAWLCYRPLSRLVPLSNIALERVIIFISFWLIVEFAGILFVRILLPKYAANLEPTAFGRVTGGLGGATKMALGLGFIVMIVVALPLSTTSLMPVKNAYGSQLVLKLVKPLIPDWDTGPALDLTSAVTVEQIITDPDSTKRIELGFMTTAVTPDPADEATMLTLINHERTSRGLHQLTINYKAQIVARTYGAALLAGGYFSHIDNAGHTPFDRLHAAGLTFTAAGENLALAPTLLQAQAGLMASPPHRANILSPDYTTVGIGVINAGSYGVMVVQDFTN